MKVTKLPEIPDNSWKPLRLEVVFETKEEADALATLLNVSAVCSSLRKRGFEPRIIREELAINGASTSGNGDMLVEIQDW